MNIKIIISPAKKMMTDDVLEPRGKPCMSDRTAVLLEVLKSMDFATLKKILSCNDEIAEVNYERFKNMDLKKNLSPALLSYDGIQYKYMSPHIFTDEYFDYVEEHLRILSGFYGILKPFDGITPYRLEMQAKLSVGGYKNLYDFWGHSLYDELVKDCDVILNLASAEYSRTITKYLSKDMRFITCSFAELTDGKLKEKGVYVKMARGEMVRFMAENNITSTEEIKYFDRLGYSFNDELSNENKYIFIKE